MSRAPLGNILGPSSSFCKGTTLMSPLDFRVAGFKLTMNAVLEQEQPDSY